MKSTILLSLAEKISLKSRIKYDKFHGENKTIIYTITNAFSILNGICIAFERLQSKRFKILIKYCFKN